MPKALHSAPPSAGPVAKPKKPKSDAALEPAVDAPKHAKSAADAAAPKVKRTKPDGAPKVKRTKPAADGAAPKVKSASKQPRKGLDLSVQRRSRKPLTARALRIEERPMAGMSRRRISTLARQHGLGSLTAEAVEAVRDVVANSAYEVLRHALLLTDVGRSKTVTAQRIVDAYADACRINHQLYLPLDDATPMDSDDRNAVGAALKDGTAPVRRRRAPKAAAEDGADDGADDDSSSA